MAKRVVQSLAVFSILLVGCLTLQADSTVGCTGPQGDNLLPSHKKPVFSELAVSQGSLSVSAFLEGPNYTNVVFKAAILHLDFESADGRQVRAPGLHYSDSLKCNYKYIAVAPQRAAYRQTVKVPKEAVVARIAMTRWCHDNEIRATPLAVKFTRDLEPAQ